MIMETEKKKNNNQIFAMTIGVPGSGKSTYLKKIKNFKVISRDAVRFAILDKYNTDEYFSHEVEVWAEFVKEIKDALDAGEDVVADATHLSKGSRRKLLNAVMPKHGENKLVIGIYFDVPLDVCLERNAQRTGRAFVPEDQIRNMYASLTRPEGEEGIDLEIIINKDGEPEMIKPLI